MTAKDKALGIYTSIHNNTSGKLSEVSKILTAIEFSNIVIDEIIKSNSDVSYWNDVKIELNNLFYFV